MRLIDGWAIISVPAHDTLLTMPDAQPLPRFRITTLLWLMALLASAMGSFGPSWGSFAAALVLFLCAVVMPKVSIIEWLVVAWICLVLIMLMTPSLSYPREANYRNWSRNNLRQVMIGLLCYDSAKGAFPSGYSVDEQGRALHSWRTHLLPFVEEQALYNMIRLDEPWDSPSNQKIVQDLAIDCFRSPREATRGSLQDETHYLAVVDEEAVIRPGKGARLRDVSDGCSNTIVLIETAGRGVYWHEPRDLSMEQAIDLLTGQTDEKHVWAERGYYVTCRYHGDGLMPRLVAFADGSVTQMPVLPSRQAARALLTAAGGETIESGFGSTTDSRDGVLIERVFHWQTIIANLMFALLSFRFLTKKRKEVALAGEA